MAAIETRDIAALSTSQIVALTTAQIQLGLTSTQVSALTTRQVEALTSDQLNALTTANFQMLTLGTPLVLDLNNDGISTQSITQGVEFDLFASGQKVHTGWISGGDGLLVLDRNHDGVINDGSELFGGATQLSSGGTASNGYEALAELDTNRDGVITSADTAFSDLRVWSDLNSDGVSQADEIRSLESLGIAKLDLAASTSMEKNSGNIEGLVSTFETTDGSTHKMADVWFVADKNEYGALPTSTTDTPAVDLSSKVSGLAEAIGSFNLSQATVQNTAVTQALDGMSNAGSLGVASNVSTIVDTLRQFDANGNLLVGTGLVQSVSSPVALTEPDLVKLANNGILVSGK